MKAWIAMDVDCTGIYCMLFFEQPELNEQGMWVSGCKTDRYPVPAYRFPVVGKGECIEIRISQI
jgi:hypothetical protein